AIQLNEKQKVRFMYGISEKQFKKLVNDSAKMKGVHGENLLILLESRLDNLVYRAGFATTRRGARQLVNHGHITVNGKKVDIPSYRVKPGDVIAIKENSADHKGIEIALANKIKRVDFINYDEAKRTATYVRYPERSELNAEINESLIVEFYSRV
ncbi:Ribosomal protein S4, bacterial-type, partial [human gut metagenome]